MENLEELKREAQSLREKFYIVRGSSDYHLVSILRLKELYSKVLHMDLESIFNSATNISFFSSLFSKRKEFDINSIQLDIINNIPIVNIAIKYQEPEYVIEEIKENINNHDNIIIKSKLYKTKELAKIFNLTTHGITTKKDFREIVEVDNTTSILYWRGDIINQHLNKLMPKTFKSLQNNFYSVKLNIDNAKYIYSINTCEILGLTKDDIVDRVKNNKKTFGVTIGYTLSTVDDSTRGYKYMYCKEEDVLLALKNKKYYMEIKKVLFNIKENRHLYIELRKAYKDKYNKSINLKNKYIKKETLNNFLNLAKELGYYNNIMGQ